MKPSDSKKVGRSVYESTARKPGGSYWILLAAVAVWPLAQGCSSQQERFATPEEAAGTLILALRSENTEELKQILGPGSEQIVSSGDEVADSQARGKFLAAYDEKNALVADPDGSMTLHVGPDDWPLPIPIVKHWGSWRFDTRRAKEEILNRRVGRNELSVVQVCLALVDAQREYHAEDRNGDGVLEYAQKAISDQGEKNGLYWETSPGEPPSPLGALVAEAMQDGFGAPKTESGQHRPFHGYVFKLLKTQGPNAPGGVRDFIVDGRMTEGFAVVAWPAEYGNSGVMTFLVSHQGIVYERDLGRRTAEIASSMPMFDPDPAWHLN